MFPRIALILSLPIFVIITGCRVVNGSGDIVTDERSIDAFDSLQLTMDADVTIIQGERTFLTIKGEDNIIERVETEVRGDDLIIRTRDRGVMTILRNTEPIEIKVSTPMLEDVSISGSGNVTADALKNEQLSFDVSGSGDISMGQLNTDELDVRISGSGNVDIDDLNAETVDVRVSGSGDISIDGQANQADLTVSGSGRVRAGDMVVDDAEIRVSGSGEVITWAEETLEVDISGSGDVSYYGSPQLDQNISGSGDIDSLGAKE